MTSPLRGLGHPAAAAGPAAAALLGDGLLLLGAAGEGAGVEAARGGPRLGLGPELHQSVHCGKLVISITSINI